MKFNVAQLLKQPVGTERRYPVHGTAEDGSQVEGEVELLRTNRSILVIAHLNTTLGSTCSRCLEPFQQSLNLDIKEEYFPTRDVPSGATLEAPGDGDFTIDEFHTLDLGEAVRQYALLARPMKPVCREDCAGLCPGCGQNLNRGPCGCPPQEEASPWGKLQELLAGARASRDEEGG